MNLIDVTRQFQNDDDCLAYLETMRWPDGIKCPTCGSGHISKVTRKSNTRTRTRMTKDGAKEKTHSVRTRIYQCLEKCTMNSKGVMVNAQFSATSGTLFNDSHLPLTKWFMAMAIIVDAKKGISSKQLQEHLGIGSYRTAWYMGHRIRKAMVDGNLMPLTGTVEIDETYIGGTAIRRFKRHMHPKAPKEMVLAMRERSTKKKVGRVRYFHVPDGKRKTLEPIIKANLQEFPTRVITDSSSVYEILFKSEYPKAHRMVNHSQEWVVPGTNFHTNTVESSFSLLKRGLIGSFHRVSIKHLHRYLTEFEYRFNARKASDRFSMTLQNMMGAGAMPYAELVQD
jgi:hypothetical protein